MRELVNANPNMNWRKKAPTGIKVLVDTTPSILDFTAQTAVAASYGLFQMLYSTALDCDWDGYVSKPGDKARKNPNYLFDTTDFLLKGGGSISAAGSYLRHLFSRVNDKSLISNPKFQTDAEFLLSFGFTFTHYNVGPPDKIEKRRITEYWTTVLTNAQARQPVPATEIF